MAPCIPLSAGYAVAYMPWPGWGTLLPLDVPWLRLAGERHLHWLHYSLLLPAALQVRPWSYALSRS